MNRVGSVGLATSMPATLQNRTTDNHQLRLVDEWKSKLSPRKYNSVDVDELSFFRSLYFLLRQLI